MSSYKDEFDLQDYAVETEADDALANEMKGNESGSLKGKSNCFPVINGVVTVKYPVKVKGEQQTFEHAFKVNEAVYIVDVAITKDGEQITAFGGQQYSYLLTCVPKKTFKNDWRVKRHIFVRYLMQLEKAIEEKQPLVKTVFGLKALEYKSEDAEEAVDIDSIDFA